MSKLFKLEDVELNFVQIEDRARKEIGDITELKESLIKHGLLSPILITAEGRLIAGERRLTAHKELKLPTITARIMPDMELDELLEIERMENVARKDFTWDEDLDLKYKMHQYWKAKAIDKDKMATWGYRETAKKMGVSVAGLSTDLALAEAIYSIPELKKMQTKGKAREAYKKMGEQAEAIKKMNDLTPEEQARFEALMSGNVLLDKDANSKDNHVLKAKHPDATPDLSDTSVGSQDEQPLEEDDPAYEEPEVTLPEAVYAIEKLEVFIPKVPDGTVGFIELDPPYAIDFNNNYGKVSNISAKEDDWTVEKLYTFYQEMLPILYEKLLPSSWVLCWTGKEHWIETNKFAEKAGFSTQTPGIWAKKSGSTNTPKTNMISNYEMFLLFRKGQATFNTASMPGVINYESPAATKRNHQWEKPLDMYNYLLSVLGRPGTIFLSPFAGSGNSMISAALNDMIPMGCDIKQKYAYTFYDNLKQAFTGE